MIEKRVCVLIPTRNRVSLLERSLSSVLDQSSLPDEVVVVNDASTDGTRQFLENFVKNHPSTHVIVIHQDVNGGVNVARNQGIRSSSSDWIMFLDDDDEFMTDAVLLARQKIREIPDDFHVFYFNTNIKKDGGEFIGGFQFKMDQRYYDPSYEDVMVKFGLRGDCKPVFRRNLFDNADYLFPESVNGFESVTLRMIAKENKKMRYYCERSTNINLQTDFAHLSFNASAKNPGAYLDLHRFEIGYHSDFYMSHPDILSKKYIDMAKLAYRGDRYDATTKYLFGGMCARLGFCLSTEAEVFTTILSVVRLYWARGIGTMQWIRLGLRYRIIPKIYIDYPFSVPFFGYRYTGNLNDYIDKQVFYFGAYEREELSLLRRYISPESIVFDIGANTGHHSLFFSKYASRVYAFEPYQKPFNVLRRRINQNNIKNVYPFNIGMGEVDTVSDFYASVNHNGGMGSFLPGHDRAKIGKLAIKNGDNFIEGLRLERVDLVKIDVEGMEISVVRGLRNTIRKYRPVVFVEAGEDSQKTLLEDNADIFCDYTAYVVNPNNPYAFVFNKPGCVLYGFDYADGVKNILYVPNKIKSYE
jgi:FkbM family methyltransferase